MVPNSTIKIGPFTTNPRINVYAIVMLLVMYAVWDEPDATFDFLAYISLVAATFMMLLAIALSHLLSESLDDQIRIGHRIAWSDHRKLIGLNAQFLLTTIPVAIVLLIPLALHWPGDAGATELIWLSLLCMYGWGVYAGKCIGYGHVARWLYGLTYLLVGLLVVTLKVLASH